MKTLAILLALITATAAEAAWVIHLDIPPIETTQRYNPVPDGVPLPPTDHKLGATGTITLTDDMSELISHDVRIIHQAPEETYYGVFDWNPGPQDLGGLEFNLSGDCVFLSPLSEGPGMNWVAGVSARSYMTLSGDGPRFEQIHLDPGYPNWSEVSNPYPRYGRWGWLIGRRTVFIPEPSCVVPLLIGCLGLVRRRRSQTI